MRHLGIRQPVITMSSLLLDREDLPANELGQVAARRLWSNVSHNRKLSCGQCDIAQQRHDDGGSSRIAHQQSSFSKILTHADSLARQKKECFGLRRNVLSHSPRTIRTWRTHAD